MSENTLTGGKELAEYSYQLGQNSKELHIKAISRENSNGIVALIPSGMTPRDMSDFVPERPKSKDANLKMYEPASFIKYVNEHSSPYSRIFASILKEPYTFHAIIDWHETGTMGRADWCKHHVYLEMSLSDNYKAWKAKDGATFPQSEFAEFLKDNRLDIIEPDNAEILQMVMDLEATSEQKYSCKLPTPEGMTLSYIENVTAMTNGTQVTIPKKIKLKIPVFTGVEPFEVECDFKFKAREGNLFFGYRMLGIDRLIRDTVKATAAKLEKETGLAVFI